VKKHGQKEAYALVVVVCLTFALCALLAGAMAYSNAMLRNATFQRNMEVSLYAAQAGVEKAAAYFNANVDAPPWSTNGTLGDATFVVTLVPAALPSEAPRTLGGLININPSQSADNEFTLREPDGTTITRDSLTKDFPGYLGPAALVHVKPKGNGNQNGLLVDGAPYQLQNSCTYDILSDTMTVNLFNDNVQNGKANGKWYISVASSCSSFIVTTD
jgi:hypothetical protein